MNLSSSNLKTPAQTSGGFGKTIFRGFAAAALFLSSGEANWITGINLPVDGGLTAGSFRMIEDLGG